MFLTRKGSMEIGLLFTVEFESPDLKIGTIVAGLQCSEKYLQTTSY